MSNIFVCDLTALSPEQRERHAATSAELFAAVQEVRELPDGYAFRLDSAMLNTVADFIASERRCCPFFAFGVEVEPRNGPLWLRLTGEEGVKPFIVAEMGSFINL